MKQHNPVQFYIKRNFRRGQNLLKVTRTWRHRNNGFTETNVEVAERSGEYRTVTDVPSRDFIGARSRYIRLKIPFESLTNVIFSIIRRDQFINEELLQVSKI